mgnify:CR=1 FL=1
MNYSRSQPAPVPQPAPSEGRKVLIAYGGAEGNDGLAAEIVALQEGADNLRSLPPPDGIAQEN